MFVALHLIHSDLVTWYEMFLVLWKVVALLAEQLPLLLIDLVDPYEKHQVLYEKEREKYRQHGTVEAILMKERRIERMPRRIQANEEYAQYLIGVEQCQIRNGRQRTIYDCPLQADRRQQNGEARLQPILRRGVFDRINCQRHDRDQKVDKEPVYNEETRTPRRTVTILLFFFLI